MATVIATVGAADANSYVTLAEADAYFADSFGRSAWGIAAQGDREVCIITASRYLDQYMTWMGEKASSIQAMEWPRMGTYDKTGRSYPNDIIPGPVRFATFELAYYILDNGGLSFASQSIDRVKVGSVDVEFSENYVDEGIPSFVEALVQHIGRTDLVDHSAARSVNLVRA